MSYASPCELILILFETPLHFMWGFKAVGGNFAKNGKYINHDE